jgi:hypothetical protein
MVAQGFEDGTSHDMPDDVAFALADEYADKYATMAVSTMDTSMAQGNTAMGAPNQVSDNFTLSAGPVPMSLQSLQETQTPEGNPVKL